MERLVGTTTRGIRTPIVRKGDDIVKVVTESVLAAAAQGGFSLSDRDVIGVTEAVVARAQGNYASVDDIAKDVRQKFPGEVLGVIFPILSRNRFSLCLKGIAKGAGKIVLMLSYPSDEVGNHLVDMEQLDEKGIDSWNELITEEKFHEMFGSRKHAFTGVDYIAYYKELIEESGCAVTVILANQPKAILKYTDQVLCCDIHTRARTKRMLKAAGAKRVLGLDDLLNTKTDPCGFNEEFGLLGSNKATEIDVKLFPRDGKVIVEDIQSRILAETGKKVEVMIYGDGAFKDPVGKIWELADPVVSPAYTVGLEGQPNEVKLKYLADNHFAHLDGEELKAAVSAYIRAKDEDLTGSMDSQGTTPRRLTDLLGSLCDLTSGSGDKGTPVVLVQGYFDNYTD